LLNNALADQLWCLQTLLVAKRVD